MEHESRTGTRSWARALTMTEPNHEKKSPQGVGDLRLDLERITLDLHSFLSWRGWTGSARLPPRRPAARPGSAGERRGPGREAKEPDPPPPFTAEAEPPVPGPQASSTEPATCASEPRAPSSLEAIRRELGDCRRCKLCKGRRNLVFGVGNPAAELVFVGEGPGSQEDARGEPFVGAAGELLDRMIAAMGYRRKDVYIANVVKCRPPNNRDPEPDEVAACEPFLKAQLAAIAPRVLVGLGRCAVQCLLQDQSASITKVRGRWTRYADIDLMPTFHPAYLLRNPAQKANVWKDLKAVLTRLGRPIP